MENKTRTIDELGRVALPKKHLNTVNWNVGTIVEVTVKDNKIILQEKTKNQQY